MRKPCSAPVAHNSSVSTHNHIVTPIVLHATDAEGDVMRVSIINQPAHGTLSIPNGLRLNYTPTAGYVGSDSFSYKVSDGKGESNLATVAIQVKKMASSTTVTQVSNGKKGGGAMSWMYLALLAMLLLVRRTPKSGVKALAFQYSKK